MTHDTQHLEYLISQYVDGGLDPASRKSLEGQLLRDPVARQLYKSQRDVQDLLDDWGNRLPLIDWQNFDKTLSARLELEVVGGQRPAIFRRWLRPMSAVAALLLAAGAGYAWRAWSTPQIAAPPEYITVQSAPQPPAAHVALEGEDPAHIASQSSVSIPEASAAALADHSRHVAILAPDAAAETPQNTTAAQPGLPGVQRSATAETLQRHPPGSVSALAVPPAKKAPAEKDPAFP